MDFFAQLLVQFNRSLPLFLLMGLGYVLSRWCGFDKKASAAMSRFALFVSLSAFLFRTMVNIFGSGQTFDPRVLIAFFGACVIVFLFGRFILAKFLGLDPVAGTVAGIACVFSNNGMLGLPLAMALLGESVIPTIAAVLSVNAMFLWTVATFFVELARRTGKLSCKSLLITFGHVFRNPLILAIFSGVLYGLTGLGIPYVIDVPLKMLADSATPLCLIVVGMGLSEYGLGAGFAKGLAISLVKLFVMPLTVFALTRVLGMGPVETMGVVFLGCLPLGVNVYIMARQFDAAQGECADAMLITTVACAFTVPLAVTILQNIL